MSAELKRIDTEQRNARAAHIDPLSTLDRVTLINSEAPRPWARPSWRGK